MKLKKWLDFLLYSNIFIALCAAAIMLETYLLIHSEINWVYCSFVFSSTLVFYGFPSLFFAEDAFSINQSERHKWIVENKKTLMFVSAISLIAVAATVFFLPLKFILWLIPNAALGFAYFFPETHLRRITGLKATIVTIVWVTTTCVYPLLLDGFSLQENWNVILERFLFMLPLCVIFNVRDVEADRIADIRTIPVVYGVKPTIIICLVSLFLFSALVLFYRGISTESIALIASAIISGILILKSSHEKKDYFYSFWIDGMILLQVGLVIL